MNRLLYVIIVLCVLVGGLSFIFSKDTADIMRKAREHFQKNEFSQALEFYASALAEDPKNYEALWKSSHALVNMGAATNNDKDKEELFNRSADFARQAVEAEPEKADGYAMLSISQGRLAMFTGGKRKVELSREVKKNAEKALTLDPKHDGALHVLGVWHREVATLGGVLKFFAKVLYGGLPKASIEESIGYLEKAVEIAPENLEHHLDLGKSYEEADEEGKARMEYEKVLALPCREGYDDGLKKEAALLLEELE